MIKIAIIEDEPIFQEQLKEVLVRFGKENAKDFEIVCFSTGVEFISDYSADYEIVFMDIDMPFMSGIKTAKLLRQQDKDVLLVFVTSFEKYAIKGYEVSAADFIVKPINYPVFVNKMKKLMEKLKPASEPVIISSTRLGKIKINLRDVTYISVDGRYVKLHTMDGVFDYKRSMKEMEAQLGQYHFIRTDKSFMVNMRYVTSVDDDGAMVNGELVPYSRSKKKALLDAFTLYWE